MLSAAYFSATQAALGALSESQARKLSEDKPFYALQLWRKRPRRVQVGLLIAHTLTHLIAGALSVHLAVALQARYAIGAGPMEWPLVLAALAAVALLVLSLGEALPRTLAARHAERIAGPLVTLSVLPQLLVLPLTAVYMTFSSAVMRFFGADERPARPALTPEDIELLLDQGALKGSLSENGERLLRSVFEFSDTLVRELMVPRTEIVSLTIDMSLDEIIEELVICGHSRLPVYEGSIDEIVGLFYAKDVLGVMASGEADNFNLRDYLRQPYFVPESKHVAELFTEFQDVRLHMAIVVDEFGGTAGVITMEDISEEIFGDIQDEYDVEPSQMVNIDKHTVRADARVPIHEIEEFFGMELPEHPDYESLGGFLMTQVGGVPEPGHEVIWEGLKFRVLEADPKRVISVLIESIPPEDPDVGEEMVS